MLLPPWQSPKPLPKARASLSFAMVNPIALRRCVSAFAAYRRRRARFRCGRRLFCSSGTMRRRTSARCPWSSANLEPRGCMRQIGTSGAQCEHKFQTAVPQRPIIANRARNSRPMRGRLIREGPPRAPLCASTCRVCRLQCDRSAPNFVAPANPIVPPGASSIGLPVGMTRAVSRSNDKTMRRRHGSDAFDRDAWPCQRARVSSGRFKW